MPGVMKVCFCPSWIPPYQKVEFCSSMGQMIPLNLYSASVLKMMVLPKVLVLLPGRLAPIVLWMSHGPRPLAAAKVGAQVTCPAPFPGSVRGRAGRGGSSHEESDEVVAFALGS